MNVDDIHLALVIAKEGSLSAASARLGITPGTLSKALARLERANKVKLFERMPRGMRPTEFGQEFLRRAERISLDANDLYAALRDLRQARSGILRCGIGDGISHQLVQVLACDLVERGVRLDLSGGMTDSLSRAVASEDLEFAVIGVRGQPETPFEWEPLIDDPLIPMAPANHPFADSSTQAEIDWHQMAQERWILTARGTLSRAEFDDNFLAKGLKPPSPTVTSRSLQRDTLLMKSLCALSLLPKSIEQHPSNQGQLRAIHPQGGWQSTRRIGIVKRAGGYLSPAAVRAIEIIKESMRS